VPAIAQEPATRSGFLPERIVHLHPTRLCNLACLHCYSASDPQQATALDADALCQALVVLRAEGYALLSLSGGEPLVYPPLLDVLRFAKGLGFRVSMISNGLLVNARHDAVLDLLDGVAISFDGLAATHNHWRGRPDAFQRASAAVQHLAAHGRPVAAAISLARDAIAELPDLADHLVGLGARALQIRPVARAGRARGLADKVFYSEADQLRLHLVTKALEQELPQVRVHGDLAPAQGLWQQRDAYAGLLGRCDGGSVDRGVIPLAERPLADLVNPLVITETGALKPVAYDFDPRFDVGRVRALSTPKLAAYKRHGLPAFRFLMGHALAGLQHQQRLLDWFDHCTRLSEQHGRVPIGVAAEQAT
jgi:Fe-coproporphyrin III synthase